LSSPWTRTRWVPADPTHLDAKPSRVVGDLAAQALITLHLQNAFPEDKIVGEEDTTELRKNEGLRNKVVGLVNEGFEKGKLGKESEGIWGEGESFSEDRWASAGSVLWWDEWDRDRTDPKGWPRDTSFTR
jgi:hypothetical protein